MTHIHSEDYIIKAPAERIFGFLSVIDNYRELMPEQVINWRTEGQACFFTIKGMTDLSMHLFETHPNSKVILQSGSPSPFHFILHCTIDEAGESSGRVSFHFEAELSPMFAMLAHNPLSNLLNTFGKNLSALAV